MAEASSYKQLVVWQKSMKLAMTVYHLTSKFPHSEIYGLSSQIRRAASSVPANIAEGSARGTAKDYCNFLSIAKGSLMETETFLTLAVGLEYITDADARPAFGLITEVSKMLTSMKNKLSFNHA